MLIRLSERASVRCYMSRFATPCIPCSLLDERLLVRASFLRDFVELRQRESHPGQNATHGFNVRSRGHRGSVGARNSVRGSGMSSMSSDPSHIESAMCVAI